MGWEKGKVGLPLLVPPPEYGHVLRRYVWQGIGFSYDKAQAILILVISEKLKEGYMEFKLVSVR